MSRDAYLRQVQAAESPTGVDNRMGSGAYSKFQFMPSTATAYAQRTAWGRGLTPDQVKAAVTGDETKAGELADMFTQDNEGVLKKAGLPVDNTTRFATHRFGPAGGVSLLRADANMPVADWVRSVTWGNGISPEAVIKQNALDRFTNVGDLRNRFITGQIGTPAPAAAPAPEPAPAPANPVQMAFMPAVPQFMDAIGSLFTGEKKPRKPGTRERERIRQQRDMLLSEQF